MQRRKKRKREKASENGNGQDDGAQVESINAAHVAVMASDLLAPLQVNDGPSQHFPITCTRSAHTLAAASSNMIIIFHRILCAGEMYPYHIATYAGTIQRHV